MWNTLIRAQPHQQPRKGHSSHTNLYLSEYRIISNLLLYPGSMSPYSMSKLIQTWNAPTIWIQ